MDWKSISEINFSCIFDLSRSSSNLVSLLFCQLRVNVVVDHILRDRARGNLSLDLNTKILGSYPMPKS